MLTNKTYKERFLEKICIDPNTNCWLWKGSVGKNGYGHFNYLRKNCWAHRIGWILLKGEIPKGLCVLHKCDIPRCVNPDHLFLGTHADNMRDMVAKGRGCKGDAHPTRVRPDIVPRGDNHYASKLTSIQVDDIKAKWATGKFYQRDLAAMYGVARTTISAIVNGHNWKGVPNGNSNTSKAVA